MTSSIFILFALVFAICLFVAKKRIQRQRACFELYEVRDDLVCLVAEGRIAEEGPVFRHFYPRINAYLELAPRVGYEAMLKTLLAVKFNGEDLDKMFKDMRRQTASIQRAPEMQSEEVRQVVAKYYQAVSRMIVAHSYLSRSAFLLLMGATSLLPALHFVAPRLWRQVRVAKFAEQKSTEIAPGASAQPA